jgi:hypothetical protein
MGQGGNEKKVHSLAQSRYLWPSVVDGSAPAGTIARYRPVIADLSEAWRIRDFNAGLGTNVTNLDAYPVDFVEAVIAWQRREQPNE